MFEHYNLVNLMEWRVEFFWDWCSSKYFKDPIVTSSSSHFNFFFKLFLQLCLILDFAKFGKKSQRILGVNAKDERHYLYKLSLQ
jgi:hypothetical protein